MSSSRKKAKKALSPLEKFGFDQISTILTHTIASPFIKLKTILQEKNSIIEYNISTNISSKCITNPSLITLFDKSNIFNILNGNFYSIFRGFIQDLSGLAIKEPLKKRIIGKKRRNTYSMLITKKFIAGYIGNMISVNFTYYLTFIIIHKRLCINNKSIDCKPYRFGILLPGFNTTMIKNLIFRMMWFTSCYVIEPYFEHRFIKKIIRKLLTYSVQFPLDTVRNRQILTNENGIVAAINIFNNYGWSSFFNGIIPKICQEFIFLGFGVFIMEQIKYKYYAEWKYDISGIRKKRKGIINLRDLCKYRELLLFKETLLVYGWIRKLIENDNMDIYIPRTLIELIKNDFFHDTKYDLLDKNVNNFVNELCLLDIDDDKEEIDRFMMQNDFEDILDNLLNERGFQNVWKYEMRRIIKEKVDLGEDIYYLRYVFCEKDTMPNVIFSCDLCGNSINNEGNYCLFWECGHSWCFQCESLMLKGNDYCNICQMSCNQYYQYCIKFRDFNVLLNK